MKKALLITSLSFLMVFNALAQDADRKNFSAELNFNFNSGVTINLDQQYPNHPSALTGVKFRYKLNEHLFLRFAMSWNYSYTITELANTFDTAIITGSKTVKSISLSTLPGIEWHFPVSHKISPYVGAELGFGWANTRTTYVNSSNGTSFNKNYDLDETVKGSSFDADLLLGADYFPVPNCYIGCEIGYVNQLYHGLPYRINKSYQENPTTILSASEPIPGVNNFYSNFGVTNGLHIGIFF